eukprot:5350380-Prymnesium_polylepis.1
MRATMRQRLRAVALRRGHVCSVPDVRLMRSLGPSCPCSSLLVPARPRSSPRRPAPSPYYHGTRLGTRVDVDAFDPEGGFTTSDCDNFRHLGLDSKRAASREEPGEGGFGEGGRPPPQEVGTVERSGSV